MIKFIKVTNQWYESLSEIKGSIFYLSLVFIPYVLLMIFLPKPLYLSSVLWPLFVAIWRFSYILIKDFGNKS